MGRIEFFNVFGPSKIYKGTMMSAGAARRRKAGRPVQYPIAPPKSIADGDQRRDFIYVDDVAA
jgi:ADP-L-glycero-D-manno-heptose 6-epimerase